MRVHVARLGHPTWDLPAQAFEGFLRTAAEVVGVRNVAAADVILFTQAHMLGPQRMRPILEHPLLTAHRPRCFAYDERDRPWLALPGLFVSMPARCFDDRYQHAVPYYATEAEEELIARRGGDTEVLFSFVGARSHPCRRAIYRLQHTRSIIRDTTGFTFYASDAVERASRRAGFLDTLTRSKFVLCPRGAGAASIRLFEVLATGRVPVIIADDWVAPPAIDWEACSIRVAERDVAGIPHLLERRERDWAQLAAGAAAAYDEHLRLADGARARLFVTALEQLRRFDAGAHFRPDRAHRRREVTVHLADRALTVRPFLGRQRRRLTTAVSGRRRP